MSTLTFLPILQHPELVAKPVFEIVRSWSGMTPRDSLWVAEIDPERADGADFCSTYGFPFSEGANCVVVVGTRGDARVLAAVVLPVGFRADFNGAIRRHLGMRRISLAPLEEVLAASSMEYGSITPIGLPADWKIIIEPSVASASRIVIGSGLLKSKISLPGSALLDLPNAVSVDGIAHQTF